MPSAGRNASRVASPPRGRRGVAPPPRLPPRGRAAIAAGPRRASQIAGKNYRLLISELYDMIEPKDCRFKCKQDKIVLLLKCGTPIVPFSSWQKLSSGAADPEFNNNMR